METVNLDSLGLIYGDAKQLQRKIEPHEVHLGGQAYRPQPVKSSFRLDVSRTSTGFALRLRFEVGLVGPCYRCLEEAKVLVAVDAREVDQPPEPMPARTAAEEEEEVEISAAELESPYVEEGILDLGAWSHDALILTLPNQIVCRPDCLGLCPYCGESLNGADPEAHDHGQKVDPRWSKLRELG
ncbi:MAG: DUF177 domain-containing protein [Solirubrobacterales bacterium]